MTTGSRDTAVREMAKDKDGKHFIIEETPEINRQKAKERRG